MQNYTFAISQVAQTSLRSIIGKSELDDLLSNRERLNQGLEVMLDSPAASWGIEIDRVEIKDVALPETMKRSMSRQAEAERERRSRIITADGEFQASQRLAEAAAAMADTRPRSSYGCSRRWWMAAEKNSTLVLPSRSRCCVTSKPSPRARRPRRERRSRPTASPLTGPSCSLKNGEPSHGRSHEGTLSGESAVGCLPLPWAPVARLRRSSPDEPGWTRRRAGKGFVYLDGDGERLADEDASGSGPGHPAGVEDVWICP